MAAPVTVLLFVCCIALFAAAESHGSTKNTETLIRYGATWRGLVWKGEYWRLFTSMFLHIGIVHLVWNLWAGFTWTSTFERILGPFRFLLVYLLSGLAGSALSVIGHDAVSAGASGALFGIIGGSIILHRRVLGSWAAFFADQGQRRNLGMVVVWLAIGPFVGFDSFGHLGGLLAGAALTWTLTPVHWGNLGAAIAAVALTVWVSLRPIPGLHDEWISRERAMAAVEREDWVEVVKATELTPAKPDPQLTWARLLALTALNRAVEAEPLLQGLTGPSVALAKARAQVHAGAAKYDKALADIEMGLQEQPKDKELLRMKVSVLLQQGAYLKADQVVERLVADAPDDLDVRVLRARVLNATRRPEEALVQVNEARRQAPGSFDAELVEVLASLGKYDEARAVLGAGKIETITRGQLACFIEASDGQWDAAQSACADPANPWLPELRAVVAAAKDDCSGATEQLAKAPPTRLSQMVRASCLIKAKQWDQSNVIIDDLVATDPTDPEALLLQLPQAFFEHGENEVLARLQGAEAQATHSVVWRLLPAETRALFPRR